ncbi:MULTISPECIES: CatA-like O-acetyltransferase [Pseudoalteromonas]|uniref:CatA-like O-acetyltransferase n=1 Tax=Pseudoalteromonas obscura TaxID=3048491 RepID=A0ABT7ESK7_9GAMM|nr:MULTISPECIES: CatA-like O-acetyltransferase [Pseudoalteromonas]MBQ4835316.1 chloramphenicol acetyltransferase [Pseudoalteromonas luteoviolacea]MDK2598041.1 CatA-like O-acetyltransferase [Pseudoalteromonas sp. P94(2023)]
MKKINLTTWERAEHFQFYQQFDDPNFNVVTSLDTHSLYVDAQEAKLPFSDCYLYCLTQTLRACDFMRLRIVDSAPVEIDDVAISSTFLAENKTFRFILLENCDSIDEFVTKNQANKQRGLKQRLLNEEFMSQSDAVDRVYVSILPWFEVYGFKHARHNGDNLGIPKVVFGKFNKEKNSLSVAIEVHHGLVDGYHLSLFLDEFRRQIIALCEYLQSKKNFRG